MVGRYVDGSGKTHGYLLSAGVFTSIDIAGAASTYAWDVNPRGQVVGWYTNAVGKAHGYLRNP